MPETRHKDKLLGAILLIGALLLPACSSVGPDNVPLAVTKPSKDGWKSFNETNTKINKAVDKTVIRPLANTNNAIVPKPIRNGLINFIGNLYQPWTAINELLQMNFKGAWHTTKRFTVNSTIGIAGLFDPATGMKLDQHREDFGQTLAVWGIKPGHYIVLPLLGPSNIRDTFGFAVDFVLDPVNFIALRNDKEELAIARSMLNALQLRSSNFDVVSEYIDREDSYDRLKLFYEQTRAFQIRNGLDAPDAVDDMFLEEPECYPADEALEGDIICDN